MEQIKQEKISLLEMARGALAEEVANKAGDIAVNLADPNTDWKKPRKMVITLEFTTDETREIAKVTATTDVKLVCSKPVTTQLMFGHDNNGELAAVELSKQSVGQQALDGGEEPERKLISLGKKEA